MLRYARGQRQGILRSPQVSHLSQAGDHAAGCARGQREGILRSPQVSHFLSRGSCCGTPGASVGDPYAAHRSVTFSAGDHAAVRPGASVRGCMLAVLCWPAERMTDLWAGGPRGFLAAAPRRTRSSRPRACARAP